MTIEQTELQKAVEAQIKKNGAKGGKATAKKYGKKHFKKLAAIRWGKK